MNERRYLWDVEQLELEHNIHELCKSAEETKLGNIKASRFPLDDVSYYPERSKNKFEEEIRRQVAICLNFNPERPLAHSNAEGDIIVFKKDDLWVALMDVKAIKDPRNIYHNINRIPLKALAPNTHKIINCNAGGYLGHIYTMDAEGSRWSIHVGKPIADSVAGAPIREIANQGALF